MNRQWGPILRIGLAVAAGLTLPGCDSQVNPPFSSGVTMSVDPPRGTGFDPGVRPTWSLDPSRPSYDESRPRSYPNLPSPE